jgi:transcription initiation factor TFIIB
VAIEVERIKEERKKIVKKEKEVAKEIEAEEGEVKVECPECGSRQLVHDYERAELVCANCGLVIDKDFIDMNQSGERSITIKG